MGAYTLPNRSPSLVAACKVPFPVPTGILRWGSLATVLLVLEFSGVHAGFALAREFLTLDVHWRCFFDSQPHPR